MEWYALVKGHFKAGRYTSEQVKVFVAAGKITPEHFKDITGEVFKKTIA
jgi:uncharacterized XkdX family phage protein